MNFPQVNFLHGQSRPLSPSEGLGNSVNITIQTKSCEVLDNPTTGHRILTGRSTPVSPTVVTNINLRSATPSYIIRQLVRDQHISRLCWQRDRLARLYLYLAAEILAAATAVGFGRDGFVMDIIYNVTYQNVVVRCDPPRDKLLRAFLLRLVLRGCVKYRGESKSSNMGTEPCSICLDDLVSGGLKLEHGIPTRMTCSHVFHDNCLFEWLQRKNTCPLCRTVLCDRL